MAYSFISGGNFREYENTDDDSDNSETYLDNEDVLITDSESEISEYSNDEQNFLDESDDDAVKFEEEEVIDVTPKEKKEHNYDYNFDLLSSFFNITKVELKKILFNRSKMVEEANTSLLEIILKNKRNNITEFKTIQHIRYNAYVEMIKNILESRKK